MSFVVLCSSVFVCVLLFYGPLWSELNKYINVNKFKNSNTYVRSIHVSSLVLIFAGLTNWSAFSIVPLYFLFFKFNVAHFLL